MFEWAQFVACSNSLPEDVFRRCTEITDARSLFMFACLQGDYSYELQLPNIIKHLNKLTDVTSIYYDIGQNKNTIFTIPADFFPKSVENFTRAFYLARCVKGNIPNQPDNLNYGNVPAKRDIRKIYKIHLVFMVLI